MVSIEANQVIATIERWAEDDIMLIELFESRLQVMRCQTRAIGADNNYLLRPRIKRRRCGNACKFGPANKRV